MRREHCLLLGAFLALTGGALVGGADADTQKTESLIAQLASPTFMEREAATKALEAIGERALEALKKAAAGTEPEARRRAEELIARIGRRLQTERLLKPTMVHLVCTDTPLEEAVSQLAKKSGYRITLSGEPAKYRNRKVDLDTGDTTFWRALDALCKSADLCEAARIEFRNGLPQEAKGRKVFEAVADVVLIDGKWQDCPVHHSGAARVCSLQADTLPRGQRKAADEILMGLGVALEPRVSLERLGGIRIEKALDDRGQNLSQVVLSEPAVVGQPLWLINGGGMPRAQLAIGQQRLALRLKAGVEPSKSIKELTGCILAEVRTLPEPVMTMDNILQAAGKTAKGKDSGLLTILEATKLENGQVRLRVDLQPPGSGDDAALGFPGVRIQQVQLIGPGAQAQPFAPDSMGLSLEDDKGKRFLLVNVPNRRFKIANNVVTHELTLLFKPGETQGEAARLHYTGSRVVHIELPFVLRDVPLP